MVMNDFQYLYIIESVKRLRLTVSEKYMVHNMEDENKILAVIDQLGIQAAMPSCRKCDGLAWSKQLLNAVNQLISNYENKN